MPPLSSKALRKVLHTALLPSLLGPPFPTDLPRPASLPRTEHQAHNIIHALPILHLREHRRTSLPHFPRIPLHNTEIGPDSLSEVALVDHQEITPRDPWPPLTRHLVPTRHIDHIYDEIRQFAGIVGSQVIPARFDEEEVTPAELAVQRLEGVQVCADVLADGGVGAPPRLDGADAGGWQGGVAVQELGVFAGEDVVGHGREGVGFAQVEEEGEQEGGLA